MRHKSFNFILVLVHILFVINRNAANIFSNIELKIYFKYNNLSQTSPHILT